MTATSPSTADTAKANVDPRVLRFVRYYSTLKATDLVDLPNIYAADATFKDPFNNVRGVPAIGRIFARMFAKLEGPTFRVHQVVTQGDDCFLTWGFDFRIKSLVKQVPEWITIEGATHIRFNPETGLVTQHRDYWDAAEELYEKLPYLRVLMKWLKMRMG